MGTCLKVGKNMEHQADKYHCLRLSHLPPSPLFLCVGDTIWISMGYFRRRSNWPTWYAVWVYTENRQCTSQINNFNGEDDDQPLDLLDRGNSTPRATHVLYGCGLKVGKSPLFPLVDYLGKFLTKLGFEQRAMNLGEWGLNGMKQKWGFHEPHDLI